jgi:hypothetical protein
VTEALELGRAAFAGQAWADAFDRLSAADRETPLEPGDLERLAAAAFLVGREDESAEAWARAHHELLARGETGPAARCAFWLAFGLLNRGELARGGGWVARARRVVADGPDRAEHGYLLWLAAFQSLLEGETAAALAGFEQAGAQGERWGEPDLAALARAGAGRALIRLGRARGRPAGRGHGGRRDRRAVTDRRRRPAPCSRAARSCSTCAGPSSGRPC